MSIISTEFLKEKYLFGINLTDDQGEPYPNSLFEHYIAAAERWLERHLDIRFGVSSYEEKHDYRIQDYQRWAWINVDRRPIVDVTSVSFQFPLDETAFTFPKEWMSFNSDPETGASRIQIIPRSGALSQILLHRGGNLLPMLHGSTGYVPDALVVKYRAGFNEQNVPADMKHLIAMQAAIGPLNIAGDLLVGAGIASISASIPGLSQSVSTTSSATNSGYGSRILEYQKEIKDLLPQLKMQFGRRNQLVVI